MALTWPKKVDTQYTYALDNIDSFFMIPQPLLIWKIWQPNMDQKVDTPYTCSWDHIDSLLKILELQLGKSWSKNCGNMALTRVQIWSQLFNITEFCYLGLSWIALKISKMPYKQRYSKKKLKMGKFMAQTWAWCGPPIWLFLNFDDCVLGCFMQSFRVLASILRDNSKFLWE